jgi:hypothetical protein
MPDTGSIDSNKKYVSDGGELRFGENLNNRISPDIKGNNTNSH